MRREEWVDISTIFGTDRIPIRAAFVISEALRKAISDGDIGRNNKWQLIEYLAADYLSGGS